MIFERKTWTSSKTGIFAKAFYKRLFTLCLVLILQACSLSPNQRQMDVSHLDQLQNWNARGKLLIRNNKEKLSGYFFWQQQASGDYKLVINSFLGINLMTLDYQNGQTTIQLDGKTYKGADPEQLVFELTGSFIPVSHLSQWMLARAPERAQTDYRDEQLIAFDYAGTDQTLWRVDYQSYQMASNLSLPNKMTIKGLNNRIKLTINEWEFLAP